VIAPGSRFRIKGSPGTDRVVAVERFDGTNYTLRVEQAPKLPGYHKPGDTFEVEPAWFVVRGALWPREGGVRPE
jgi:hypothetical protein